jgi:hypothetical protein
MQRPNKNDYSANQETYIKAVEGDNILIVLEDQLNTVPEFLASIPENKGEYAYADGKWTVKQVIEHIIDSERVFAFRALCIARGEKQTLPGFEQDDYVNEAHSNQRKIAELAVEFRKVREANLSLFKSFNEEVINKRGNVYDYQITINAILYSIAGHLNHHLNILKERYLN